MKKNVLKSVEIKTDPFGRTYYRLVYSYNKTRISYEVTEEMKPFINEEPKKVRYNRTTDVYCSDGTAFTRFNNFFKVVKKIRAARVK